MKEDAVFNAMVVAMENRLNYPCRDMGDVNTHSPFRINLGRQAGHTTGAVKFMRKYHNRCILVGHSEAMVRLVRRNYGHILGTNVDYIINSSSTNFLEKCYGTNLLRGKDVVIIDTFSLLDGEQKQYLSMLLGAMNRSNNSNPTAIFELQ